MYRYLSVRDHSRAELFQKCTRIGFSELEINRQLQNLEKKGWVDDQNFARQYAKSKLNKKWGPQKIRSFLYQKGVQKLYIDAAISEVMSEINQHDLLKLASKRIFGKLNRISEVDVKRRKLYQFLITKGFSHSEILSHLDRLLTEITNEKI